ncbi:hypothetical protein T11_8620 [Trichinella zimbabwensis]|uniref:Uncharacterized protein n=1 Tax=Trichinella zimbabwensis TaxID=268475 RepID=A0A0V1I967_9BILA|nr:hypothetical protein T11_8620 [Trichinella zimbabwensis]
MHKPWLDTLRRRYWPIGFEVVCFRNEPKFYSPWDRVAKPPTSYWSNALVCAREVSKLFDNKPPEANYKVG